jgi:hypothetical protein
MIAFGEQSAGADSVRAADPHGRRATALQVQRVTHAEGRKYVGGVGDVRAGHEGEVDVRAVGADRPLRSLELLGQAFLIAAVLAWRRPMVGLAGGAVLCAVYLASVVTSGPAVFIAY